MRWKSIFLICLSGAVFLTGCVWSQKKARTSSLSNPRVEEGVTTWDKVKFGRYYQEAEFSTEPIKWRVLSVDKDNNALLLADKILDAKPYDESMVNPAVHYREVLWKDSALRKWLNEDFYNAAFDAGEKNAILDTTVDVEIWNGYNEHSSSTDKVYLLSMDEARNTEYGFESGEFESEIVSESDTRRTENTHYTKFMSSSGDNYGRWWLRSPIDKTLGAPIVYNSGDIWCDGDWTRNDSCGIRPVLRVNLSSPVVTSAGEVDSRGEILEEGGEISNPVIEDGVTIWSCVYFGHYRQEFVKQDIEWRVLSVDGDDVFLLADKNLDVQPYHEEEGAITWKECTLRKWLNEDFYNAAFNEEEQNVIMETAVINEDNPYHKTEGGGNSTDKVYLLSIDETMNAEYGFYGKFIEGDDTRKAYNTDYVKLKSERTDTGYGIWLLRSPGESSNNVSYFNDNGSGTDYKTDYSKYGIRPVIHIKQSSSLWEKTGVVSSATYDVAEIKS